MFQIVAALLVLLVSVAVAVEVLVAVSNKNHLWPLYLILVIPALLFLTGLFLLHMTWEPTLYTVAITNRRIMTRTRRHRYYSCLCSLNICLLSGVTLSRTTVLITSYPWGPATERATQQTLGLLLPRIPDSLPADAVVRFHELASEHQARSNAYAYAPCVPPAPLPTLLPPLSPDHSLYPLYTQHVASSAPGERLLYATHSYSYMCFVFVLQFLVMILLCAVVVALRPSNFLVVLFFAGIAVSATAVFVYVISPIMPMRGGLLLTETRLFMASQPLPWSVPTFKQLANFNEAEFRSEPLTYQLNDDSGGVPPLFAGAGFLCPTLPKADVVALSAYILSIACPESNIASV